jgi:hypothetical protein
MTRAPDDDIDACFEIGPPPFYFLNAVQTTLLRQLKTTWKTDLIAVIVAISRVSGPRYLKEVDTKSTLEQPTFRCRSS